MASPSSGSPARAVLWDMDGTLLDSTNYHWLAWRATLRVEGIQLLYDRFLASFGQRNDTILRSHFGRAIPLAEIKGEWPVRGVGCEPRFDLCEETTGSWPLDPGTSTERPEGLLEHSEPQSLFGRKARVTRLGGWSFRHRILVDRTEVTIVTDGPEDGVSGRPDGSLQHRFP